MRIGRTPDLEKPVGTFARHILDRLLVDLSWASSQLEGKTYSLLERKRLIEYGQAAEGKDAAETQMILNHKLAIEFLVDSRLRLRHSEEGNMPVPFRAGAIGNKELPGRVPNRG